MSRSLQSPKSRLPKTSIVLVATVAALVVFVVIRQSSNTVVLGSPWIDRGLMNIEQVCHDEWSELLGRYVDHRGRVDYERWHRNGNDIRKLVDYLETLSRVHWKSDLTPSSQLSTTRNHELAFWINAYNALTIRAILNVFPTSSVRRHTNPVGFDIWHHYKLMVGSRAFSLEDIANGPLPDLQEPRIHFAIVRGSVSCPALRQQAFHPARIEQQLSDATRRFLDRSDCLKVEGTARIHLSPVVREALPQMGKNVRMQRQALARLMCDPAISDLVKCDTIPLSYFRHDWSLNKQ